MVKSAFDRTTLIVLLLAAITAFAMAQFGELAVDPQPGAFTVGGDPAIALNRDVAATFGAESAVIVFVEHPSLFSVARLQALRDAVARLAKIDGVVRVDSLFSVPDTRTAALQTAAAPFSTDSPPTDEQVLDWRRELLANPFARNLLSADATATLLYVYADVHPGDPTAPGDARLVEQVEEAVAPLREVAAFGGISRSFDRVLLTGPAPLRVATAESLTAGRYLVWLCALGVTLAAVYWLTRSAHGVLLAALIAVLSSCWTLGLLVVAGLPLNGLTALLPALVVVLGSGRTVHLLHNALNTKDAKGTFGRPGLGFWLGCMTLAVGLGAIAVHDMTALRQFAFATASGFLFHLLLGVVLVPMYLRKFEIGRRGGVVEAMQPVIGRVAALLARVAASGRMTALLAGAVVALAVLGRAFWLPAENDPDVALDSAAMPRAAASAVATKLHGTRDLRILFDARSPGAFRSVELLNELKKVQDYIQQVGLFDATLSVVDLLAAGAGESGGDGRYTRALPDPAQTEQLLESGFDRRFVEPYLSADHARAIIRIWHHHTGSAELAAALARLRAFTDTLDKRLAVSIVGGQVPATNAAASLPGGQLASLLTLASVAVLLMSVLFLSLQAGLIVLIPGLVTVLMLFSLQAYLGFPVTAWTAAATAIVAAVSLGFTAQLMVGYNRAIYNAAGEKLALESALRTEMPLLAGMAFAYAGGFAAFLIAGYGPHRSVGWIGASMIPLGLLVSLIITPKLMASMRFVSLWGMANVDISRDLLERCALFDGMQTWQIKQVVLMSQLRGVAAGTTFIRQDAVDTEMYVIMAGQASVERVSADGSVDVVRRVHTGDVIGEIALVSRQPRQANVRAETDLELLVFEWSTLERLGRFLPMISARLFLNIAAVIGKRLAN